MMLRDLLISLDEAKIKELISKLETILKDLNIHTSISIHEGRALAEVTLGNNALFIYRYNEVLSEFYLRIINTKLLNFLVDTGFTDLVRILLKGYLKSIPKSISISKVNTSKSLYILIEGYEAPTAIPTIRVIYRKDFAEATASFCRVSRDENTCLLLYELLRFAKKLWNECFL